jgi:hypothetical protein
LANFLLKDSLDLIIKRTKNIFLINFFLGVLAIFHDIVKNEAEKSVKTGQNVVQLKTAVALVIYNLE